MKYGFRRLLALAVAVLLTLAPAFAHAQESLLTRRMDQAYAAGRQVEASFSAQMGDGLALFLPEDTFGPVQQLLADTRIVVRWAEGEVGPVVGLAVAIGDAELLTGTVRSSADDTAFAIETSLLPGKTLLMPHEALATDLGALAELAPLPMEVELEPGLAAGADTYERYLAVAMNWANENGVLTQSDAPVAGTDARSAAAESVHIRATAAQLKALIVALTEEFENDTELQGALAPLLKASGESGSAAELAQSLSERARRLEPLEDTLALDIYLDQDGVPVGLDMTMEPMFESRPQSAFAQYDRMNEGDLSTHAFQGVADLPSGGSAALLVNYVDEGGASNLQLQASVQPTSDESITQVTLSDDRKTKLSDGQERVTDVLGLALESLMPDGSGPEEGAMALNALISTEAVTNEGVGDDFDSNIAVSVQALGMEFASFTLALQSSEYAPHDTSDNAVVDLSALNEEEQAALVEELQTGLSMALISALAVIPPELLQMAMGAAE